MKPSPCAEILASYLVGATVLVTGAGGSIGSELCRQILPHRPARLLLLGRGENSIYQVHLTLKADIALEGAPETDLVPIIADIRDRPRIKSILARYRPSVVFHAAAHKHVPLMETNPSEAVATNVFGTGNLLDAAGQEGVERLVLVSTDKAVNPSSVMGATKRAAELLLVDAAARTGRPWCAVRFGNVLGSRGSVLPLWRRQIEAGGPVTVTHPDATRYLMTIPQAASLILAAGGLAHGGEVFVLDMGEPVRILDLARQVIRESGREVPVRVVGLRPGEKLREELFTHQEGRAATLHERIFVSTLEGAGGGLERGLAQLAALLEQGEEAGVRQALSAVVPEFGSGAAERERSRGVGLMGNVGLVGAST